MHARQFQVCLIIPQAGIDLKIPPAGLATKFRLPNVFIHEWIIGGNNSMPVQAGSSAMERIHPVFEGCMHTSS